MRTLALILLLLSPAALAEECPQYPSGFITAQATRVIDGQTFAAKIKADDGSRMRVRIRLFGIIVDEQQNWPWGPRAKDHLIGLADVDTEFGCVKIHTDQSCYLVAWCINADENFAVSLVRHGLAVPDYDYLTVPGAEVLDGLATDIFAARDDARAAKRGIWAD